MQLKVILLAAAVSAFPFSLPGSDSVNLASSQEERRLLKLGPNEYRIATEEDKLELKKQHIYFIDYTNQISVEQAVSQGLVGNDFGFSWVQKLLGTKEAPKVELPVYKYPKELKYQKEVKSLFRGISLLDVRENLETFTSFHTRYYKSASGLESANWLYEKISSVIQPVADKVSITKIDHPGWDQYSIIVSIPGESTDKIILGAHQDSTNLLFPNTLAAPGADDDGSGTVTILEALRLIIGEYATGSFKPHNTLEFHFYSAEEGGLLGSIDIFTRYAAANETVLAMLQQDMTGSTDRTISNGIEPHFGLISDNVSANLNEYLKRIISTYNSIPYHESQCGYGCSDHASAFEKGYPSAFLIESEMQYSSRYIHSVLDTVDRIDFDHVKEHIKLSVAYAYELSNAKHLK